MCIFCVQAIWWTNECLDYNWNIVFWHPPLLGLYSYWLGMNDFPHTNNDGDNIVQRG